MRISAHRLRPLAPPTVTPHPVATPSPPAVPPALNVGRGGRPPGLLAVSHVPQNKPLQTKSNHRITRPATATPHCPCTATPFTPPIKAPIKAKTPAIVHDQGKSRQTRKTNTIPSANGAAPYQPRATPWEQANRLSPALKGRPIPPIKAKTPVIVHDQGKSRHP